MTRIVLLYALASGQRYPDSRTVRIATDPEICLWMSITVQPLFYYTGQHRTLADIPQAGDITNQQLPIN